MLCPDREREANPRQPFYIGRENLMRSRARQRAVYRQAIDDARRCYLAAATTRATSERLAAGTFPFRIPETRHTPHDCRGGGPPCCYVSVTMPLQNCWPLPVSTSYLRTNESLPSPAMR
jgi:hypothetical protein